MRGVGCAFVLLSISTASAFAAEIDVQAMIRKSVAANNADLDAQPNYIHRETDRDDDNPSRTYDVMMILGTPYQRLVAIGGEPLPPDDQQKEQQKMQQAIAARQKETARERADRISKYNKLRRQERLLMAQIANAFDFTLLGEGKLNGHNVYIFDARPKPGYRPPNQKARVLTGMHGKLWLDKSDYHWVKVEAEVVKPVSIEGFLARVYPGTRFALEKAPVSNGIWEPTRFSMSVVSKILGFISHNSQEEDTYSNYRPVCGTVSAMAARP